MRKYIILSVNDNPDYLFHVPLVCWAWIKIGWEPIVFFYGNRDTVPVKTEFPFEYYIAEIDPMPEYKSETITQVSRLYGACVADGYLMTGDIDMLPLSDYWKPDSDKLTVWGRDLTDYHYPICYIGAPSAIWKDIMGLVDEDYNSMIKYDLDRLPQASSSDKVKRWVSDQDLITERINNSSYVPHRVDRGTDKRTGYPIGRIDRSHWTLDHRQYIDAHLFHGIQRDEDKFKKVLEMLHFNWPLEDWKWFINYYKEFKKLCQIK
jgi:hypothetical protein